MGSDPQAARAAAESTSGGGRLILYAATSNAGKVRELARRLGAGVELRRLPAGFGLPEESGSTYAENARIKARALCRATGEAALADDSGLEVDALGGRPGLWSSRYGIDDADRIKRLLRELSGATQRSARFRCALALVRPDGRETLVEATCEGAIVEEARGTGGFGYDPVFAPCGSDRTFAELSTEEKDRVSHRGQAVRRLRQILDDER